MDRFRAGKYLSSQVINILHILSITYILIGAIKKVDFASF